MDIWEIISTNNNYIGIYNFKIFKAKTTIVEMIFTNSISTIKFN